MMWAIVSSSPWCWLWRSDAIGWRGLSSHSLYGQITETSSTCSQLSGSTYASPVGRSFLGRFNFTFSYRLGSHNIKPNTLSRIYTAGESSSDPAPILPSSCFVAAVTWEIESQVRQAQALQPDPGNGPTNCLFVPDSVRSQRAYSLTAIQASPGPFHSSVNTSGGPLWTQTPGLVQPVCNKMSTKPRAGLLRHTLLWIL